MNSIIVGLGNPGKRYVSTRHNVGYILLDLLAKKQNCSWKFNEKLFGYIALAKASDSLLVKPSTFMNSSGSCVQAILTYYKIPPENLIIVHDDVDLPAFEVRDSFASSSGGHHGVEDIIERIGTSKFRRIRVGIGRPENKSYNVEDYVLSNFSSLDLEKLRGSVFDHLLSSLGI